MHASDAWADSSCLQVSRRLTRKIKQALYDRQLGYVKIAVAAYIFLLDESQDEDSSYSLNYFATELIHQPDSAVSSVLGSWADGGLLNRSPPDRHSDHPP